MSKHELGDERFVLAVLLTDNAPASTSQIDSFNSALNVTGHTGHAFSVDDFPTLVETLDIAVAPCIIDRETGRRLYGFSSTEAIVHWMNGGEGNAM